MRMPSRSAGSERKSASPIGRRGSLTIGINNAKTAEPGMNRKRALAIAAAIRTAAGQLSVAHLLVVEIREQRIEIGDRAVVFPGALEFLGGASAQDVGPGLVRGGSCPRQKRHCLLPIIALTRH